MQIEQTPPKESWPAILDAIGRLIQLLVNLLGVWGFLGLLAAIVIAAAWYKRYNDKRKNRDADLALQEKDKSIQRLADEVRLWRVLFFKEKFGWTDDEVHRFVMRNEFPDAASSRRALEGDASPARPAASNEEG